MTSGRTIDDRVFGSTMKVSLICTIKNEERSIERLLDSILAQTRPPDEVVIVDGGSSDRTREIVGSYIARGAPLRLIVAEGANISRGRNIAVQSSTHELIACTDGGCEPDGAWLERLIEPFQSDPTLDVVGGAYEFSGDTPFGRAAARILSRRLPTMDGVVMPAGRAVAFRKGAWLKAGGFPEHLDYAEDTTFDFNLRVAGCRLGMASEAVVVKKVRRDARGLYKQYYNYSKWDVLARNPKRKGRIRKALLLSAAVVTVPLATLVNALAGAVLLGAAGLYYFVRYGVLMSLASGEPRDLVNGPLAVFSIMLGETVGALSGALGSQTM